MLCGCLCVPEMSINVPTCEAVLRKQMYISRCKLHEVENVMIDGVENPTRRCSSTAGMCTLYKCLMLMRFM